MSAFALYTSDDGDLTPAGVLCFSSFFRVQQKVSLFHPLHLTGRELIYLGRNHSPRQNGGLLCQLLG